MMVPLAFFSIITFFHIIILEMETLQIFRPLSKNNTLVESVYIATKCMIHIKTWGSVIFWDEALIDYFDEDFAI